MLTSYSERVPHWITDAEGQKNQRRFWDDVAEELERIESGCVKKALQLGDGS